MEQNSATGFTDAEVVLAGLTIAFGVIVPGILKYLLTDAGYPFIGTLVWAFGFGSIAIAFWYRFILPLDITGPD
jgi:hypothetical protein